MHAQPPTSVRIAALGAIIGLGIAIALGGFARNVHAESVFKCRAADGAIAFQDRPCAHGSIESQVEIAPPPPVPAAPDYGRAPPPQQRVAHERSQGKGNRANERREVVSFECRAANGEVFYRHGACPKQITVPGTAPRGKTAQSYGVSTQPLPRADVCRRLNSAGSIGRAGHARDENISTYDRNLGRDPCRYL